MPHLSHVLRLTALIALFMALTACGGDAPDGPGDARVQSGAKTPDELVDKLVAIGTADGFSPADFVTLVHPDQQPATAFIFSVLPMAFAPLMVAFAEGDKKKEMQAVLGDIEALMKRYELEDATDRLDALKEKGGELSDEAKMEAFNEAMRGVDHMGLMRDTWALLAKLSDDNDLSKGAKQGFSKFDAEAIEKARAELKVDGDRATMPDPTDPENPLVLVKAEDGYWYISALGSGIFSK